MSSGSECMFFRVLLDGHGFPSVAKSIDIFMVQLSLLNEYSQTINMKGRLTLRLAGVYPLDNGSSFGFVIDGVGLSRKSLDNLTVDYCEFLEAKSREAETKTESE